MRSAACAPQIHQLVEEGQVVKEGWNGYNVLHDVASRVAALDIGFLPSASATEVLPAPPCPAPPNLPALFVLKSIRCCQRLITSSIRLQQPSLVRVCFACHTPCCVSTP